jgi:hypothetical protein
MGKKILAGVVGIFVGTGLGMTLGNRKATPE